MASTDSHDDSESLPEGAASRSASRRYLDTDHLRHDLARRSIRAGTVTLAAQAGKVAIQMLAVVVLARLLEPSDFGRFAMVGTVLALLEIFKDLGLSTATVQRADISHRQISTLFWLNLSLGCLMALSAAALGPLLAWLYGEPVLVEITPVVACAFILTGLSVQHLALLRRQMQFATVVGLQVSAEVIAIGAAVAAALVGLGLWSLVVQRIVWAFATAVGAWWACGWVPGRPGPFADIRGFLSFGANSTGAMAVGHLAANLDKLLIGWYWGAASLGLYDRAQKIAQLPIQNLNAPLANVALAALSRLVDQPMRYRAAYLATVERIGCLMVPVCALLVSAADCAVPLVLGPQWHEAVPILSWMGIAILYMPVTYSLGWLYMTQDRTGEMLRAGAANAGLTVAAILIGLPFGGTGVAAALSLSGAFVRAPLLFWLVARRGPIGFEDLARVLILPTLATGIIAASLHAVRLWPAFGHLSPSMQLAIFVAIAGVLTPVVYATIARGRRILIDAIRLPQLLFGQKASA